jgi:hypothetical protein
MGRERRRQYRTNINNKFVFSRNTIIVIAVLVVIISIVCYFAIRSMIPVNGNSPVFGAPKNNFVKASHNPKSRLHLCGSISWRSKKKFRSNYWQLDK